MSRHAVFIDANVLVYYLDQSSDWHQEVVANLQNIIDLGQILYTSHHVLEEVLFIVYRLSSSKTQVITALSTVQELPIHLIEPELEIDFAERYLRLFKENKIGINDALLLQLILDGGVSQLFTYDQDFLKVAQRAGVQSWELTT